MISLLLFLITGEFRANLDDLPITPSRSTLYSVDGSFLLCDYSAPGLYLFSPQGAVLKRYDAEGQGPGELERPFVLGVSDSDILVVSQSRNILVFDKELNLKSEHYTPLPEEISSHVFLSGNCLGKNRFLLVMSGLTQGKKYMALEIVYRDKQWEVSGRHFSQITPKSIKNPMPQAPSAINFWLAPDEMRFFKYRSGIFSTEDSYEVFELDPDFTRSENAWTVQALWSDVGDIRPFMPQFRCFIHRVKKLESGYVVEINISREGMVHDFFDENGAFLRRDREDYRIIPSVNSRHVFKTIDDGEHQWLVPLEP